MPSGPRAPQRGSETEQIAPHMPLQKHFSYILIVFAPIFPSDASASAYIVGKTVRMARHWHRGPKAQYMWHSSQSPQWRHLEYAGSRDPWNIVNLRCYCEAYLEGFHSSGRHSLGIGCVCLLAEKLGLDSLRVTHLQCWVHLDVLVSSPQNPLWSSCTTCTSNSRIHY